MYLGNINFVCSNWKKPLYLSCNKINVSDLLVLKT